MYSEMRKPVRETSPKRILGAFLTSSGVHGMHVRKDCSSGIHGEQQSGTGALCIHTGSWKWGAEALPHCYGR